MVQLWWLSPYNVRVLGDIPANRAVVDIETVALLQVICDLSQGHVLEVQIKRGGHNARVVLHALKSLFRHEFSRA